MSAGKEPADSSTKPRISRLPAPSLFVGPPSRNASNLSLTSPKEGGSSSAKPLSRQRSRLGQSSEVHDVPSSPVESNTSGGLSRHPTVQISTWEGVSNERTDALWAEMQNTLEEVELNATSGTHVFGPGHSRALEELRTAQIALAQAWAKSEADEDQTGSTSATAHSGSAGATNPINTVDSLSGDRANKLGQVAATQPAGSKTQLEEDTEKDIALARQRREANDRYFERVNQGVLEVVKKLEVVAKAMKDVEVESKEIWGERDSIDTASIEYMKV
ncbi:uncharacterized protein PV09_03746 [Verruconis gallopava]|uniref:Uncharacterized protein n=1 Tax=Verruconis gallopava TaxID=253628 RepID=A0A0D1YWV4_9PEZI|nr:uncharacterized protein PV09_03746 [Verruconis gallopava]KIW05202.1 hypothetical protein PV09_03746 [Verruconis gallopava]